MKSTSSRSRWGRAIAAAAMIGLRSPARDWRWLERLRDARGASFKAGVVVHSGAQTLPLGDRLWAIPYAALWA
jgi:hypothetical protein